MSAVNLGNHLNQVVNHAKNSLFAQGELAQLTHSAFNLAVITIQNEGKEEIEISYPVGYSPSRIPITSTNKYKREQLIERYSFLANNQLAINGMYQLVAIVEAMLGDVIRAVIMKYPQKISNKKTISVSVVLAASSIDEIHFQAVDYMLNELSYKSPKDFAESLNGLVSVNLLECPAFHKYLELKATSDIYIHNRGVANEIYVNKSGSHHRVNIGQVIPVDTQYFLESYEYCLQLTEWIEIHLNEIWPSSEMENRKASSASQDNINA